MIPKFTFGITLFLSEQLFNVPTNLNLMESKNNFQNHNSDFENGIIKLTAGMAIGLAAMAFTGNPIAGMIAGKVFLVSQQGK